MTRPRFIAFHVITVALCLCLPIEVVGQTVVSSGLGDVNCVAVEVELSAHLAGLVTQEQLRTAVERTLRTNGIAVGCESADSLAGRVRFSLVALPLDDQVTGLPGVTMYSATSFMEFSRYFSGGPGLSVWAAPWYRYNIFVWGRTAVPDAANREARSLTEEFVNAVLAARQRARP